MFNPQRLPCFLCTPISQGRALEVTCQPAKKCGVLKHYTIMSEEGGGGREKKKRSIASFFDEWHGEMWLG